MSDLRNRIADVQSEHQARANSCLCGWEYDPIIDDSHFDHVADVLIRELELKYEYENGRVMYSYKPAACKPNGHWKVRIVSPHKLYEGEE